MLHFISILVPDRNRATGSGPQRPAFGPDQHLSRAERDAAILADKAPPRADEDTPLTPRFVTLLAPPFL